MKQTAVWLTSWMLMIASLPSNLLGHCQMPCGIYHDEMVYDMVDQYIETTVKGITVLQDMKGDTLRDKNTFVRWIMYKEKSSNEIADIILTYFIQQKIKPGEPDTAKRLVSAHNLLFYLMQIKQMVDLQVVSDFYEEWEKFKLFFHIEGYKCKVSHAKLKKWQEQKDQAGGTASASHSHSEDEEDHHHD